MALIHWLVLVIRMVPHIDVEFVMKTLVLVLVETEHADKAFIIKFKAIPCHGQIRPES